MQVPETKYARSADGLRLAYQQWGEGPPLLIVPALVSNVEVAWEHPVYLRIHEYMGRYFTCAQFDKRGIGLSDRPEDPPTLEQRIGDIVAVMDELGWERAHLLGMSEGGVMSQLFAADHPERVDRLVLTDTFVPMRYLRPDSRPGRARRPSVRTASTRCAMFRTLADGWPENTDYFLDWFMPSQLDDRVAALVRSVAAALGEPADFARQVESVLRLDAGDAPERITAPTLVMHVNGDRVLPVAAAAARRPRSGREVRRVHAATTISRGSCRTGARWPTSSSSSAPGSPRRVDHAAASPRCCSPTSSTRRSSPRPSATPRGARCSTATTGSPAASSTSTAAGW